MSSATPDHPFAFTVRATSSRSQARCGRIYTAHGTIDTPSFVPVGTHATLKGIDPATAAALGIELMFCNTYHLMLQPGRETIRQAGGLHRFINCQRALITDSGGFQIFSLAYGSIGEELKRQRSKRGDSLVSKICEEGVYFRSYRDGTSLLLTPENSIAAQKDFGADIILPLDELSPYHLSHSRQRDAFARTHRWQQRSLEQHAKNRQQQAIYGIIHGGVDLQLRSQSCRLLSKLPFDGFAIGGTLGKTRREMEGVLRHVLPLLPKERPVHLLGVGDLTTLETAIALGIDTFDSSYPTKAARHGVALTATNPLHLTNRKCQQCFAPIMADCACSTCRRYTQAYLHHLFKAKELTAMTLTTVHNLFFIQKWMEQHRAAIVHGVDGVRA